MKTVIIWLVMLFAISVVPVKDIPIKARYMDKLLHAILYAITCALFYMVLLRKYARWKSLGIAVVASSAYGALMELAQHYLARGRTLSKQDMAANAAGALVWALYIAATSRQSAATKQSP